MRAIVIYWSHGGNTEKVGRAIGEGLTDAGVDVTRLCVADAGDVDWYAYDLVCLGFPSYQWRPPKPMDDYLNRSYARCRSLGRVRVGAPPLPGKHALIFCTYSGQHTGIREATPAAQYAGQFLEHVGIPVWDEWYVVGQYHGNQEANSLGRLGDIEGRPTADDLHAVRERARRLPATIWPARNDDRIHR